MQVKQWSSSNSTPSWLDRDRHGVYQVYNANKCEKAMRQSIGPFASLHTSRRLSDSDVIVGETLVSPESGQRVQITYRIEKLYADQNIYIVFGGPSIKKAAIQLRFHPETRPSPLAISAKKVELANLIRCIVSSRPALAPLANPAPAAILAYDLKTCCIGNVVECTVYYFQQ